MFKIKKIDLNNFFAAKGQDEEVNEYLITLYKQINSPEFYLKDIEVNGKVMNDWIKYGLVDEASEKGKWRKFSFKEAIWIKFIEELRFFGIPLKTIKSIKKTIYELNEEMIKEAILFFKINAEENEINKTILDSYNEIQDNILKNKLDEISIYCNLFNTMIVHTLSSGINPVYIFNNNIEGFFDIGGASSIISDDDNIKSTLEDVISNQSVVLINLRSLILKFFSSEKPNTELTYYLGLMNKKEKELIEQIRSTNYSKITVNLQDGRIVLTKAQKKDNDELVKQLARIMKRGDFVDLELSARDGKIIKLNKTELIK